MTVDDISALAAAGKEMPPNLDSAQQRLFQNLRLLYAQYRLGYVTAEQGGREKTEIIQTYKLDNLYIRAFSDTVKVRQGVGYLLNERSECPVCRQVGMILDGRQSP